MAAMELARKEVLPRLTAREKAELLSVVEQQTSRVFPGIEKTPAVCGGRACVAGKRLPVWGLEEARRLGATEAELLTRYPTLSAAQLASAWPMSKPIKRRSTAISRRTVLLRHGAALCRRALPRSGIRALSFALLLKGLPSMREKSIASFPKTDSYRRADSRLQNRAVKADSPARRTNEHNRFDGGKAR